MPTLYLIDGYAQFFRAFHAIRTPMTSPVTKEPTNMTFGFVGMLLKLLRAEGTHLQGEGAPTHVAVALDVGGDRGTFRSQIYPAYKANRDEPPEGLGEQVTRCLEILAKIGVPIVFAEGFEADDVIAAIATHYSEAHPDVRVRIVSKDKDLKQLLGSGQPPTEMYDIHTEALITAETLKEETGLEPAQVIDMLALMGDTVDNVPGVPGIGPKTAAQLISEFGSLDAVVEEVQADKPAKEWKIKGKRRENIAAFADQLPLSKELVTLRADAPVSLDLDGARRDTLNLEALLPILKELGFNRYQDEVKALLGMAPGAGEEGGRSESISAPAKASRAAGFGGSLFEQHDEPLAIAVDGEYTCVRTKKDLDGLVKALKKSTRFAVDTETTALRPMKAHLAGLSFSVEPYRAWYVPVRAPEGEEHLDESTVLNALRPILEDDTKAKIGHNIKYDLIILRRAGVDLRGFDHAQAGDSMVASYLIDSSRSSHSMDALALALLKHENISIKDLIGSGKNQKRFDEVPLDLAAPYAAEDADITLRLHERMDPVLRAMGLGELYHGVELPLVEVLAELEYNGIAVDPDELDHQRERLEKEIERLKREVADTAMETVGREFDIDSPKQLSGILFNKPGAEEPGLGLKPIKKTKTGYSTDAEVLQKLVDDASIDSPLPALILEYRQLAKLVSTYLVALKEEINDETGRIHASFNQTVAATGRLSSSDPNLQNIPIRTDIGREIRRAFVAPPARVLITADYSQIELRLLAHLSRDPALTEAFINGEDIHAAVAAQIHAVPLSEVTREQRNGAKMVNFGIVYGITPFGLARRLGCSNTEADEIITGYKKRFAGITTFLEECVAQAKRHGYVETMLKRRRLIPDIDASQPNRRALAERTAINSVVQGSAADLIKLAMIDLHRRIRLANPGGAARRAASENQAPPKESNAQLGTRLGEPGHLAGVLMLLQIHDELVFEAPADTADQARAVIVDRMQHAMDLDVPLIVDSGISGNWYEAK
ncbi:MAG: DNA polymerase I [Phycisphaeraceae bacterium]|nr:MAG: DNA polymerase I [Phycisphaeraceae bacterium]